GGPDTALPAIPRSRRHRRCARSSLHRPYRGWPCAAAQVRRPGVYRSLDSWRSEVEPEELFELVDDVIELLRGQAGPDAEPEGLVHHGVGVRQLATHAEVAADHV